MTARRLVAIVIALAAGCAEGPSGAGETATAETSTSTGDPASTTTSSTTATTGVTGTGESDASGAADSSSGAPLQLCGIEDLAPGAANPLIASDRAPMQLPTEIADILARSCGCHLADDLVVPGDYPQGGTLDLRTWPAWHSPFGDDMTYEVARGRLDPDVPILVMPPQQCDVGGGETMRPEDRARLLEWIDAMAPDGVTWSQG